MNKNAILGKLQQTRLFKSLTKESQQKLIAKWGDLSEKQIMKIIAMVTFEDYMRDLILQNQNKL